MPFTISEPFMPDQANMPLDSRTVVSNEADILSIKLPYEGMLVYCKSTKKIYKITSLKTVKIGPIESADECAVGTYEEFTAGSGGGSLTQIQADWNQTNTSSPDYIKNKPELLQGPKGDPGKDGTDGYTPQRGVDFWTTEDVNTINTYIDEAVRNASTAITNAHMDNIADNGAW